MQAPEGHAAEGHGPEGHATGAHIEVPAPGTEHEQSAFGLGPPGWVALSMIVVILIAVWKGVPKMLAGGLDKRIATIRAQLDEAAALRREAEALHAESAARTASAVADAEAIVAGARNEAALLLEKAKVDADELIVRRRHMAEDKIAAAERSAIADVRAKAAQAAAAAAGEIIARRHDAYADRQLVDRTIANLG